ncbi:MAG: FtsB family cell division protein [Mycobacteriaceae bacterium]
MAQDSRGRDRRASGRKPAPGPGSRDPRRSKRRDEQAVARPSLSRPARASSGQSEDVATVKPKVIRKVTTKTEVVDQEKAPALTAKRAVILVSVVCALGLTMAVPLRTYFGQQAERERLVAQRVQLEAELEMLGQQKGQLADPAYIQAQARNRLGFVLPGEIPFQVQLPHSAAINEIEKKKQAARSADPWYTKLWNSIADSPVSPDQIGTTK